MSHFSDHLDDSVYGGGIFLLHKLLNINTIIDQHEYCPDNPSLRRRNESLWLHHIEEACKVVNNLHLQLSGRMLSGHLVHKVPVRGERALKGSSEIVMVKWMDGPL